jgi:type IV pilus assembly protein PilW
LGVPTSPSANVCFEPGSSYEAFLGNIRQGIWGANNSNPFSANCILSSQFSAGNDVLVVRRLSGSAVTALVANTVYFHSTYAQGQMFRGTTAPSFSAVNSSTNFLADYAVLEYVYFISPYTVSSTESPLVPSLRRMALDSTGKMVDELVTSGIEHMHVQYARLDANGNVRYLNASDIGGGSADTPTTNTGYQWDEVNSVQIWLLARNATAEPGYSNSQTYVMGDASLVKADSYRRQLFSTVVQLRN